MKINKRSVYLDTSIFSYLIDERENLKSFIEITKDWWDTQKRYFKLFISSEVIAELQLGKYPNKKTAIDIAESIEILPRTDEIREIAEIYIENFIMPKNYEGNAIHLAYSSLYKIDFLLTWSCKHLANANKKLHIRKINTKLGLFVPEIITPLELFKED
jgi:predicted nucleic acid-binding protein